MFNKAPLVTQNAHGSMKYIFLNVRLYQINDIVVVKVIIKVPIPRWQEQASSRSVCEDRPLHQGVGRRDAERTEAARTHHC